MVMTTAADLSHVTVCRHPLAAHYLSLLRNKETSCEGFRSAIQQVARFVMEEACRDLPLATVTVETPLCATQTPMLDPAVPILVMPILRAGLMIADTAIALIPSAKVYHIGLYRGQGSSYARNQGIRVAQGEILIFLDDDVWLHRHYLEAIQQAFEDPNLKADCIGGKILVRVVGKKPPWFEGPLRGVFAHVDYGDNIQPYQGKGKHVPFGGNMAVRRDTLVRLDGFSEQLVGRVGDKLWANEDVLTSYQIKASGARVIYVPRMTIYHLISADRLQISAMQQRFYCLGRSDAQLLRITQGTLPWKLWLEKLFVSLQRACIGLCRFPFFPRNSMERHWQYFRIFYNWGYLQGLFKNL